MASNLRIDVTYDPRAYFAMQQNSVPMVQLLRLTNLGEEDLADLDVTVATVPELAAPWTRRVSSVPKGATYNLPDVDLHLRADALVAVTERTHGSLKVRVKQGDTLVAETELPLDVLAYNEWPGAGSLPAVLAAFVLPNHPELAPVLVDASHRLAALTGNGALDGYQSQDPKRARAMAQALWEAVAARQLVYVSPPPSFEQQGQKVRTPEQVLGERLATCLDLAVFYAACCEAVGLNPLVVLWREHASAGVWLVPGSASEAAIGDALELQKRVELDAMAVIECTLLCGDNPAPFQRSCEQGIRQLRDKEFVFAIDVAAARTAGMRPLPLRSGSFAPLQDAGLAVPLSTVDAPAPRRELAEVVAPPPPPPPEDRLTRWKRRLLDLSLRNRLLSFKPSKQTVKLLCADVAEWEDALAQGRQFALLPRPQLGGDDDPRDLERRQQESGQDVMADYLRTELQRGRLHCDHTEDDLATRLTAVFRAARTSLEETGANTLYLAVGFLKWFETPQSQQERLAPILLLPLRLERLSMAEGFRVAMADEDPQLNHSLLQKLERDFGLRLPGLQELPEDGTGVDVQNVLQQFRAAVVAIPRWQVLPEASIGFFSFTKHLMWLDLEERSEALRDSDLVKHLIDTPEAAFVQDGEPPAERELDELPPEQLFCPLDADGSQLRAVLAAADGRSFVLEGPPGTGKSQTITNLIVQALAAGKRVLFVAEKRAALEVVQQRLSRVGLGPFCLELHSHKGSKQVVVQQLKQTLEIGREAEPEEFAQRARELQQARQRLNMFVAALHRRRAIGRTVYEVTGQLAARRGDPYVKGLPIDIDADGLAARRQAVAALQQSAIDLGVAPAQHPWHGSRLSEWRPALLRELPPLLRPLQDGVQALTAATASWTAQLGLAAEAMSRAQLPLLRELGELLRQGPMPAGLIEVADFAGAKARLLEVCATGRERDAARQDLLQRWQKELLRLDLAQLRVQFQLHSERFFLLRWWKLRGPKAQLRTVHQGKLPDNQAIAKDLDKALHLGELQASIDQAAAEATSWLGALWRGGDAEWSKVEALMQRCERLRQLSAALCGDAAVLAALRQRCLELAKGAAEAALPECDLFDRALSGYTAALQPLDAILQLDLDAAFGEARAPGALLRIAARVDGWPGHEAMLREHSGFRRDVDAAEALGLQPLLLALFAEQLPPAALQAAFEFSFGQDWLDAVLASEPELGRFRGLDHERAIQKFRLLDREMMALAGKVARARLSAQLPQQRATSVASSELGILQREIIKKSRHLPVRQLLLRIPNLLPRLVPCLLMSPLSVAQFLSAGFPIADLVVFDEASQIPVWDAVGALGRGHSAVIVGDSKQLPPTAFFQRADAGDDDEPRDDSVVEELESVLDECNAAGLERLYLRWHYRSRHESLIAFSNHHYYDNRLLTFPSPDATREHRGVQLRYVPGIYDRAKSQQNLIEAEALVAEVCARLMDPERSRQSLGIVTFSSSQQHLIEDLLDRERSKEPGLDRFFTNDQPVFVKNLENVQGDERDVMLFSIGYGPDAAGKVWVNFGPLNQRGGERRLNVAITRARQELLVFTSMRPEQIDLRRVNSLGARHLLTFLDYAARGPQAIAEAIALDPNRGVESPFERVVRDALVQRGYELHEQVGCSGYRIDLAVVDPRAPGRYLLGIECDGATYHAAATARDRDRLRQSVLEGLGWKLVRIWSTDWWQDQQSELQRVEAAIQQALQQPLPVPRVEPVVAAAPAVVVVEAEATEPVAAPAAESPAAEAAPAPELPRYEALSLPVAGDAEAFHSPASNRRLRAQCDQVLAREAPIAFELLCRRLLPAWGIGRITDRVRDRVRAVLPGDARRDDDDVLWAAGQDPAGFATFRVPAEGDDAAARDAEHLPIAEIANAMAWLLTQHGGLGTDDLLRLAARLFGISRLGSSVRAAMRRGLELLASQGRGVVEGEQVRLP